MAWEEEEGEEAEVEKAGEVGVWGVEAWEVVVRVDQ